MKKAIYPGTFDPITNGHIDIIQRASKIFDYIILAISNSFHKNVFFDINERLNLAKKATSHISNVKILCFNGLMIDCAKKNKINIVIRGIRSISDFSQELSLVYMNRTLFDGLESIFIVPDAKNSFISSSLIKDIAFCKGNFEKFVPKKVFEDIKKKFNK